MKNFAKILATISITAAFSFAQYTEYEDNEPWPTSENQENAQEESITNTQEESSPENITIKDSHQKKEEDDAVSRVLAQKRAKDAARKEEERQKALRDEQELSLIDQTTANSNKVQKSTAGIGFRADFNIGSFYGTKDLEDGVDEPSGYGFDVGITARFEILDILWFTPEILFEAYWLNQEEEAFNREFNQMNLTAPLMLRAILPFFTRVYFEVGPQLSINISQKSEFDTDHSEIHVPGSDIVLPNTYKEDDIEQTTFALGFSMGLGFYIIPNYLAFNIRFYAGMTELYPDAKSNLSERDDNRIMYGTKLNSIRLGLNAWFL